MSYQQNPLIQAVLSWMEILQSINRWQITQWVGEDDEFSLDQIPVADGFLKEWYMDLLLPTYHDKLISPASARKL